MKKIRYLAEAFLLGLALIIFRAMPVDTASSLGGRIGRTIGPRIAGSRKALRNLQKAMPEKSTEEHRTIIEDMWENLGRVIAEYPHLQTIINERTEIVGEEHVDAVGIDSPMIIVSAHVANWELGPFYFNYRKHWPMAGIYRAPNNPYVEKMLDRLRNPERRGNYIAKSHKGVREMVKTLQDGGRLGNLIDQKYNQGIPVPFFGRPAMTSAAPAQLAEKFDCPLLPLQIERLQGCRFRITFYPAFKPGGMDDMAVMEKLHGMLEDWIRNAPGQWLWLHRRWDSKIFKSQPTPPLP
jgi:KDO2-lipid IV(A) lauroyltransferase